VLAEETWFADNYHELSREVFLPPCWHELFFEHACWLRPWMPRWRMHCGAEVTESSTNKQHHLSAENKLSTDNSKRRLKLAWWEQRTQWHYRHWKQLKKDLNFFGQWALCAAELTLARAGGGEDKKASCRDSMTLCWAELAHHWYGTSGECTKTSAAWPVPKLTQSASRPASCAHATVRAIS